MPAICHCLRAVLLRTAAHVQGSGFLWFLCSYICEVTILYLCKKSKKNTRQDQDIREPNFKYFHFSHSWRLSSLMVPCIHILFVQFQGFPDLNHKLLTAFLIQTKVILSCWKNWYQLLSVWCTCSVSQLCCISVLFSAQTSVAALMAAPCAFANQTRQKELNLIGQVRPKNELN